MSTFPQRLGAISTAAALKPHGTRARYIAARCRCMLCRAANSCYSTSRAAAIAEGDYRGLVDATAARKHIHALGSHGVGYKSVAAAAAVATSVVAKIRSGERVKIRASTERAILAVDDQAIADHALVPANLAWRLLNLLIDSGYTRTWLAARLGSTAKKPGLQLSRQSVTAAKASKVVRLYKLIQEGRISR